MIGKLEYSIWKNVIRVEFFSLKGSNFKTNFFTFDKLLMRLLSDWSELVLPVLSWHWNQCHYCYCGPVLQRRSRFWLAKIPTDWQGFRNQYSLSSVMSGTARNRNETCSKWPLNGSSQSLSYVTQIWVQLKMHRIAFSLSLNISIWKCQNFIINEKTSNLLTFEQSFCAKLDPWGIILIFC